MAVRPRRFTVRREHEPLERQTIRFNRTLLAWARAEAKARNITVNRFVNEVIEEKRAQSERERFEQELAQQYRRAAADQAAIAADFAALDAEGWPD